MGVRKVKSEQEETRRDERGKTIQRRSGKAMKEDGNHEGREGRKGGEDTEERESRGEITGRRGERGRTMRNKRREEHGYTEGTEVWKRQKGAKE